MITKRAILISLTLFIFFTACSQKYDDESNFRVSPLDAGKTVTITGYAGNKQTITIPQKIGGLSVTGIGKDAFRGKEIISVIIPKNVTEIEDDAFAGNLLTSITIPNGVKAIGNSTFADNQLTSVTIPNGVTSIAEFAFARNQLTSVTIPNSVTSIGAYAFAGNQLTSVTILNGVTSIGLGAFEDNQLTSVSISNKVTTIGDNTTFAIKNFFLLSKDETKLFLYFGDEKSITIPDGVTTVEDGAFSEKQLTSITFPKGVTDIGRYAFSNNQLTSVSIPDNVNLDYSMFDYSELMRITLGTNVRLSNMFIQTPDGYSYNKLWKAFQRGGVGTYTQSSGEWTRLGTQR